jgi:predicted nucleic acid-binding protein
LVERALRSRRGILLLQALAEFYSVATRKLRTPPDLARAFVHHQGAVLPVHGALAGDLDLAMASVQDHGLSFWDALLWATADRVGVRYLLTEDFQDGRRLGRVTFVNPFDPANVALLDRELPPPASRV